MSDNQYVLVRCTAAGVHAGELVSMDGSQVSLTRSRRLWYWRAAEEAFLSGVARCGIDADQSKVGGEIDVTLTDACEIINMTDAAAETVRTAPVYTP